MEVSASCSDRAVATEPDGKSLTTTTRSKRRRKTTPSVRDFIPNLVTGAFLKSVFYLNPECSKNVIVGIFQNFCNSTGILVNGKKGFAYWSPQVFNQLQVSFNEVTLALGEMKGVRRFGLQNGSGEDIVVKNVFGKRYAVLSGGNHSIPLTATEWNQFINSIPCMQRRIDELFLCEDLIKAYISDLFLVEGDQYVSSPVGLPAHLCDTLFDEVAYFKRWLRIKDDTEEERGTGNG